MPPKRRPETCRPIRTPTPRPPRGSTTGIPGTAAALDADPIAPDSSAAIFPVIRISPLEHGRNGAAVDKTNDIAGLDGQTAPRGPFDPQRLFATVSNLQAFPEGCDKWIMHGASLWRV